MMSLYGSFAVIYLFLLFIYISLHIVLNNLCNAHVYILLRGGLHRRPERRRRGKLKASTSHVLRVNAGSGSRKRKSTKSNSDATFGFDNNANVHYTGDRSILSNYRTINNLTVDGLGGTAIVTGVGTIRGRSSTSNNGTFDWELHDVLYIEGCESNIISTHVFLEQVDDAVKFVTLKNGDPYLKLSDSRKIRLKVRNYICEIDFKLLQSKSRRSYSGDIAVRLRQSLASFSPRLYSNNNNVVVDIKYAHVLLGHPNKRKMTYMLKHHLVDGITWKDGDLGPCYPCELGKSKLNRRDTKSNNNGKYSRRGQLVVSDVEGPISTSSFNGNQFAVHFTDMYSRYSVVYMMKKKSEVGGKLLRYIDEECIPRGVKIECIQTDGAAEYVEKDTLFQKTCRRLQIARRVSSPYCHWENGAAERVILTMMEKSFTILAHRSLPAQFWCLALHHAYALENRLPHAAFNDEDTPYHRWHDRKPNASKIHVFGCDVRVNVPLDSGYKKYTDDKAWMGIYVGFYDDKSSHKIWRAGIDGAPAKSHDIGDRNCKFLEVFDEKLFLRTSDNEDFIKYAFTERERIENDASDLSKVDGSYRVAKRFRRLLFFGTAVPNNEPGEYKYNVVYDDGDIENMDDVELRLCRKLFAEVSRSDPRAQPETEEDLYLLRRGFKLKEIIDHKIYVNSFNDFVGCLRIKITVKCDDGVKTITRWVEAGSLLVYRAEEDNNVWIMVRDYLRGEYLADEDETRYHRFVFKFFETTTRSKSARKNVDKCNLLSTSYDPDNETMTTISGKQSVVVKPIHRLRELRANYSTVLNDGIHEAPKNYFEACAMACEQWVQATKRCIGDLQLAEVGTWIKRKDYRGRPISSRFVYQVKHRPNGTVEAFCRWTPRGYEEVADEHYDPNNIFAATPQLCILRFLLNEALLKDYVTFHLDFKRAFSHAPLCDDVAVTMPKGYTLYDDDGDEIMLLLDKSSEGLKQSAANWTAYLTGFIKKSGFEQCPKEPCVWRKMFKDGSQVDIEIYVDDVFGVMPKGREKWLEEFVKYLGDNCAPVKNLGEIKTCLGIDVEWSDDRRTVSISCKEKIKSLLRTFDFLDVKGRSTPLIPGSDFDRDHKSGNLLNETMKKKFMSITGSLLYITRAARPEMAYAVWYLACGMSAPTDELWEQALHVLRYCHATMDDRLVYTRDARDDDSHIQMESLGYTTDVPVAFCDSNWSTSTSVSSNIVTVNNAALLWRSRKQTRPSLSSIQAELTSLTAMGQDVEYIRDMWDWLGMSLKDPTLILCDNKGAIQNARHPSFSDKLRHVERSVFYIRDVVERGAAVVEWIPGAINPADCGTKPLGGVLQRIFGSFLMGASTSASATTNKLKKRVVSMSRCLRSHV